MINTILTSPYKSNIIDVVQFEKGVIIMNKRIDKKKQKRTLESAVTATATSSAPATATPVVEIKEVVKEVKVPVEVPAKNPAFYLLVSDKWRELPDFLQRVPWRVQWIY